MHRHRHEPATSSIPRQQHRGTLHPLSRPELPALGLCPFEHWRPSFGSDAGAVGVRQVDERLVEHGLRERLSSARVIDGCAGSPGQAPWPPPSSRSSYRHLLMVGGCGRTRTRKRPGRSVECVEPAPPVSQFERRPKAPGAKRRSGGHRCTSEPPSTDTLIAPPADPPGSSAVPCPPHGRASGSVRTMRPSTDSPHCVRENLVHCVTLVRGSKSEYFTALIGSRRGGSLCDRREKPFSSACSLCRSC